MIGIVVIVLIPPAEALGFFGPRTYLVLSQDPAELRPYGGYIGAYGAVQLLFGRISSLDYGDSKDLDTGDAPRLFAASDSPDFPTAASAMADAYTSATDTRVDALIAVDPVAASGLLDLVGPLTVPGEATPVTASNLLGIVLLHTQNFDDPDVDRKQFIFDLGHTLADRLRALPPTRWPDILAVLGRAAAERHVQMFFSNPVGQRLAHSQGWDGAFPPPTDDFLAVVDDNVGYNKANLVVDQRLEYLVVLGADGTASAALTVTYQNQGTSQLNFLATSMPYLNEVTYDGRLNVYVPAGSKRLSLGTRSDPEPSLGRTVFAEQVRVEPETQQSVLLRYRLPDWSVQGGRTTYDLLVRKQSGTIATPIRVTVTGPDRWHVVGTQAREWVSETVLSTDRHFEVAFEAPQAG